MQFFKTKKGIITVSTAVVAIIGITFLFFRNSNTPENKIPAAKYKVHVVYEYKKNGKIHKQDRGYSYYYFGDLKKSNQNQTSNQVIVSSDDVVVTNEASFNALASQSRYTTTYNFTDNGIELFRKNSLVSLIKIKKITKDGFEADEYNARDYKEDGEKADVFKVKAVRVNDIATD